MNGPVLRHDLVVCTKDRPADLAGALRSVATQTSPPATVWVVDASEGDETRDLCRRFRSDGMAIEWVGSPAGTGLQRNTGVRRSSADVVHFVDDDVVLDDRYFESIMAGFARHPDALGVGGLPTNLPAFHPSRLRRLLAPASTRQGAVLRSGRGVLVHDATTDVHVDWLSGCCMSFRRSALLREPFDEGLAGYALGEDLDVSYRIRQLGPLIVTPRAELVHLESPTNRLDVEEWMRRDLVNRHRRVVRRTGHLRPVWFWAGAVAQLVLYGARGLVGPPRARAAARGLWAGMGQLVALPPLRR